MMDGTVVGKPGMLVIIRVVVFISKVFGGGSGDIDLE